MYNLKNVNSHKAVKENIDRTRTSFRTIRTFGFSSLYILLEPCERQMKGGIENHEY